MDSYAKPIQIIQKSVKNIKEKSFSFDDFMESLEDKETFTALKTPKVEFHYKNIIPLPNFLTKTFIHLDSTDPFSVAKAFINAIVDFDLSSIGPDQESDSTKDNNNDDKLDNLQDPDTDDNFTESPPESPEKMLLRSKKSPIDLSARATLLHIVQFCHLCLKGKITPLLYSLSLNDGIEHWFKSLPVTNIRIPKLTTS
jgi:hypothetical protein